MQILILALLSLLAYIFIYLAVSICKKNRSRFPSVATLTLAFVALGLFLIILAFVAQITGKYRLFLIAAGVSPTAMLLSIILHNIVYSVTKKAIGKEFEEPFFLLFGVFGCPAIFIIGVLGSLFLTIKGIFTG